MQQILILSFHLPNPTFSIPPSTMSAVPFDKSTPVEHHVDDEKDVAIVNEVDVDPDVIDIVHAAEGEYTDAEYKKLLRKIDWMLLPLMWLTYGLQQADKTATSTQATFGLRTDTHLVGQQYSVSIAAITGDCKRLYTFLSGYQPSSTSPTSSVNSLATTCSIDSTSVELWGDSCSLGG